MDAKYGKLHASISEDQQIIVNQVIQAILQDDAESAAKLFESHSWLGSFIDVPCFAFDAPALVFAASKGSRRMVDVLLENGADINVKSQWWAGGFGVLHHEHHELARYLIERGASVDPHAAASLGMLEALKRMIEDDPLAVNQPGPDGQAPLHFAVEPDIIDYLLAQGADIDMRDIDHGSTPAQWSVDNPEKCQYLIDRGAETDVFMACMVGDAERLRDLIESDSNCLKAQVGKGSFTSGDSDGGHIYVYKIGADTRPFTLAARMDNPKITELILKHSSIQERLLFACLQADTAAVHAIKSEHPQIIHSLYPEDQSLIAHAAWNNQLDAVRTMLEAGFPVDARIHPQSATALHQSACRGNSAAVQILLAHGASVDAINEFGGTPLGSCIWGSLHFKDPLGDYAATAELLIEAGAKLPERASGSDSVQEVLIGYGVSVDY